MKKLLISAGFIVTLLVSCMFGITANAAVEDISGATVTLSKTSYTYTGSEIKPGVKAEFTTTDEFGNPVSVELEKDVDYKLTYSNNVDAGTATVKLSGIGNYKGTNSVNFTINPYSVKGDDIEAVVKGRTYPNKKPKVVVKFKSKVLTEGTDYSVSVSNNSKAGTKAGVIKITGKGNFKNTKTGNYTIYPSDVKNVKVKSVAQNNISLTWDAVKDQGINGYKVYSADVDGKNAKLLATVKSNSANLTKVDSATRYNLFVLAYVTNDNGTVKSSMNNVCVTCTKPKKVKLNYCAKKKNLKIYANWDKVYNASGYQIRFSIDKNYKNYVRYAKAKASATSKTIDVQTTSVAHFVTVRAYKTYKYNGKKYTVYGPWSVKMSTVFGKVYKTYSTNYVNNPDRTNNLKLACKAINGTIIQPGQTFSFNKVVGKRTAAKGYKPAPIFTGSTGHANGVGGGICQVASTMFNAALLSNFKIVERYQHSQKVSYVPAGRDAAIYWGSENFQFKNTLKYPIKIKMTCKDGKVTCQYLVSYNIKAPDVKLNVTKNGKKYKLTRTVNGKVNYTAYSTY